MITAGLTPIESPFRTREAQRDISLITFQVHYNTALNHLLIMTTIRWQNCRGDIYWGYLQSYPISCTCHKASSIIEWSTKTHGRGQMIICAANLSTVTALTLF